MLDSNERDDSERLEAGSKPEAASNSGIAAGVSAPGNLQIVPRDLRSAAAAGDAASASQLPARVEPTVNALVPDERDAERVAFAMWREGRTDDAIAFLEREILLEKDRVWKRDASTADASRISASRSLDRVTPPPTPKAAPKRKRKRSQDATPVSEPTFSDASAPVIDLSAEQVTSAPIVPPPSRMGRGPMIVAAIGLVIVGFAAAANVWDNRRAAEIVQARALVTLPAKDDALEPAATASVTPAPAKPAAKFCRSRARFPIARAGPSRGGARHDAGRARRSAALASNTSASIGPDAASDIDPTRS